MEIQEYKGSGRTGHYVLRDLWKRKIRLLVGLLLGGLIGFGLARFVVPPVYQSGFSVYVSNYKEEKPSLTSEDLAISQALAQSYGAVFLSREAQEMALEAAELRKESPDFAVVSVQGQIVTVYVRMNEKQKAYDTALAMAELLPDYAGQIVEGSSAKIVEMPMMPRSPYCPDPVIWSACGGLIGLVLMLLIGTVASLKDTRIKEADQLQRKFGIPVIGSIPDPLAVEKLDAKYDDKFSETFDDKADSDGGGEYS